jgi:hypothetical protein
MGRTNAHFWHMGEDYAVGVSVRDPINRNRTLTSKLAVVGSLGKKKRA